MQFLKYLTSNSNKCPIILKLTISKIAELSPCADYVDNFQLFRQKHSAKNSLYGLIIWQYSKHEKVRAYTTGVYSKQCSTSL